MAEPLPPDTHFTALLRRLDELLHEATHLRDEIQAAMSSKTESPFWPDRRHERHPVPTERRK